MKKHFFLCTVFSSLMLLQSLQCGDEGQVSLQNSAGNADQKKKTYIATPVIRQVYADVVPAPGEQFHVASKHVWSFAVGTYDRNNLQQFQITDRERAVFCLDFYLTNAMEDGMKPLRSDTDFQDYMKKQFSALLKTTIEKNLIFHSFRPAGMPGVYVLLHVQPENPEKPPLFSTMESGMCRISEKCILSYVLKYNGRLEPETRLQLYEILTKLAKCDDQGDRSRHVLADTSSAWAFAVKELPEKVGLKEFSEQFPFLLEFKNDTWIFVGQPQLPGVKPFLFKVSTKTGEILQNPDAKKN